MILNKWILIQVTTIVFFNSLSAQQIQRSALSAGGDHFTTDQTSLSFTLGQSGFAGTLHAANLTLTVGFQQMDGLMPTTIHDYRNDISITAFPNPFSEYVHIAIDLNQGSKMSFRLFDSSGKLVVHKKNIELIPEHHKELIYSPKLLNGMYHIEVGLNLNGGEVLHYTLPLLHIK